MTKEEIILFEKKLYEEYSKKLKNVREEFLKNSEIQVGDKVEIFFESRDYGKESGKSSRWFFYNWKQLAPL